MSFAEHWKALLQTTPDASTWSDADRRMAQIFYNWGALDLLNGQADGLASEFHKIHRRAADGA